VHAAAINPVDDKVRSGMFSAFMKYPMPLILGWDVSGVVEQVGKGVTKFKVGDAVFAYMNIQKAGAYAEYAVVREADACPKPEKLTHVQAAAIPLAATTAWQALIDTAKLEKGQTVLIHGGAGGVGHFAIQIAKARGAKVVATGSTKSLPFLRELGADTAIDYTAAKFEDVVKDVDIVLDTIGGDTQTRSFAVLKKGGMLVSIVQPPDQTMAKAKEVRAAIFLAHPDGAELAEIVKLVDSGKLKPTVSQTFKLADASKAHEQIETKHTKGKIVLEVLPTSGATNPK
jgi:NADPH:quinone reductase-like Zn-dependent oxidoreductase